MRVTSNEISILLSTQVNNHILYMELKVFRIAGWHAFIIQTSAVIAKFNLLVEIFMMRWVQMFILIDVYKNKTEIWRLIRIRKSKDRQHIVQKKKDKQRSTKHTHKTKDWVTQTPLNTEGEFRCSKRVSSFCSTSGNPSCFIYM